MVNLRIFLRAVVACALALIALPSHAATPAVTASANSCALDVAGAVYCWGSNRYGALGQGMPTAQPLPAPVLGLAPGLSAIAASGVHTCAIDGAGGLKCWGNNSHGQLGTGNATDSSSPVQVSGLTSGVLAVSLSPYYSCAVLNSGGVSCWGGGGLPGGPVDFTNVPRPVAGLPADIKSIATGIEHACALSAQGAVWCWGSNYIGQLGNASTVSTRTPVPVSGLSSGVVSISATRDHTCAVRSTGGVACWGRNSFGNLGNGTTDTSLVPVPVTGLSSGIASVAAGYDHTCAVTLGGALRCWGSNQFAQFGNNSADSSLTPIAVATLSSGVVSYATAGYTGCVLVTDGGLLCWGVNSTGQVGNGTADIFIVPLPTRVAGLPAVRAVAAGDNHTCALTVAREMLCWGNTLDGALGTATLQNSVTPLTVRGLPGDLRTVGTGGLHSCALRSGGEVVCWGASYFGASGNNAPLGPGAGGTPTPVTVPGLPPAQALSVGSIHNCIVSASSEAWCWGYNADGQLGNGNSGVFASTGTPQRVSGLGNVSVVVAGAAHTCAIGIGGGVSCWGYNGWGQLGNGTRADSAIPVAVAGLGSGVAALALGWYRSCALTNAGAVLCWGQSETMTPAPVPGLASGATAIAVGGQHACALKAGGEMVCWGGNAYGQLGDGTTATRLVPVAVAGLPPGITSIATGVNHTCVVTLGGIVACWGGNENGELGDGTFAVRSRPAVVLRLNGAGGVASGDWYLDLNPAVGKTIPADRIPAFLAVASGSSLSSVTAQVRFRAQDVGKRIHVFAYAPASIVRGALAAKDGPSCVLAQVTSSGLQQLSAANLGSYASDVQSAQQQSVSILQSVSAAQVAGATFCVGAGSTGTDSVNTANNQCVVTVPGNQVCLPDATSSSAVVANVPGVYSGLWWNAAESGWGINFTQRGSNMFVAWYTYDASGNPKWYVASNCAMSGAGCSGLLYEVSGPRFFSSAFNPALAAVAQAGSVQLSFADTSRGTMSYTLNGQSRSVAITRQLAQGPASGAVIDYTDLWWNPGESGWGAAITQYASQMFLAWYVYDAGGKPVWYVASNCALTADGDGCSGTLYRTTGPAFGPTFNPASVQVFEAGTVSLQFSDGNNGRLSYTVGGVASSKAITRQLF